MDLPVIFGNESLNLFLALDDDGQRRCLHAADRGEVEAAGLGIERRHRPRAVDTHQPVGLGTTDRGVRQRAHGRIIAQGGKPLSNRRRCHGLQPQALDRFVRSGVADDVTKNQFTFPPGVAGVDQGVDLLALDEPDQQLQTRFVFFDRLEVEMRRDDRQMRESPLAALDLVAFGHGQFEQMANGRRQDVAVALIIIVLFLETAERLGDVAGDGRFFGYD